VGFQSADTIGSESKKRVRPSARKESTALFLLRCIQLGLSMADLEELTVGMIYDIMIERKNDEYEWPEEATLEEIMNF